MTKKIDNKCLGRQGFTLVEIIVVVIILSIAALLSIPMFASAADMQLTTAANMIAADIDYAKNLAITKQQNFSIVFRIDTDSYEVRDEDNIPIEHPVNPGNLTVVFPSDSRTSRVDITSANFDANTDRALTFDYLGSPYSGLTATNPLNSGTITLAADDFTITITVEPVTGYVTISSF